MGDSSKSNSNSSRGALHRFCDAILCGCCARPSSSMEGGMEVGNLERDTSNVKLDTMAADRQDTSAKSADWLPTWFRTRAPSIGPNDHKLASTTSTPKDAKISKYVLPAASFVFFALESIEKLGEGLPGIGAAGVVLSILRKVKGDIENKEDLTEALEYVEGVLNDIDAGALDSGDIHAPSLDSSGFVEKLQDIQRLLKKKNETNRGVYGHIRAVISAEDDKEELKAIVDRTNRAMARHQMKWTKMVFQMARSEMNKDEEDRMDRLVKSLPIAKEASFDSYRTKKVLPCTPDTRVGVQDHIRGWATGDGDSRRIFWLNGLAGTGKSTLSMSTAIWAKEKDILGGSFFFSRDTSDLSNPGLVFPTLAYQLSQFDLGYRRALCDALKKDSLIPTKNLPLQFELLIQKPLSACEDPRSILIVLDALDECYPETDVKLILGLLSRLEKIDSTKIRLRIFIASRPEAYIRGAFHPLGEGHHDLLELHEIDESIVRGDIQIYLRAELSGLAEEFQVSEEWPPKDEFESLLNDCGQFFEYAATAVRFIADSKVHDPPKQLRKILEIQRGTPTMARPYSNLDGLYLGVLGNAVSANFDKGDLDVIRTVVATVILARDPMRVEGLAAFLSMTVGGVRNALYNVHSVVIVPDDDTEPVRVFHPSFPDFLKDASRCTDLRFLVDSSHEYFLASRSIDIMNEGLRDVEIIYGESNGVKSSSLWHAVSCWTSYLSRAKLDNPLARKLRDFVGDYDLFRKWCFVNGFRRVELHLELGTLEKDISENLSSLLLRRREDLANFKIVSPTKYLERDEILQEAQESQSKQGLMSSKPDVYWSQKHNMKVFVKRRLVDISYEWFVTQWTAREICVWAELQHRNILPFFGYYIEDEFTRPNLVSPWMVNGALDDHMRNFPRGGKLTRDMLLGIACGLDYLHSRGFVHGRVRCQNILVSNDSRPLLSNFSRTRPSGYRTSTFDGPGSSERWIAPECLGEGLVYELKSAIDIWAFGMVGYELLSGKVPYSHRSFFIAEVFVLEKGELPPKPENVSQCEEFDSLWKICQSCWQKDPSMRPTANQLMRLLKEMQNSGSDLAQAREGFLNSGDPTDSDGRERDLRYWKLLESIDDGEVEMEA